MYYINSTPNTSGNYGNPMGQPFSGCRNLPDELLSTYIEARGFVTLTTDGDTVTEVETNQDALEAYLALNPEPDVLTEAKDAKQEENKTALAQWLADHPLTWTDGKQYGVEEQDQNEMALNLMQYQAAQLASQVAPLEWHAQKEACREFTQEEYIGLSMAISNYVYPYRRYQESVKEAIYAAETMEELEAVVIDYSSVSNV